MEAVDRVAGSLGVGRAVNDMVPISIDNQQFLILFGDPAACRGAIDGKMADRLLGLAIEDGEDRSQDLGAVTELQDIGPS